MRSLFPKPLMRGSIENDKILPVFRQYEVEFKKRDLMGEKEVEVEEKEIYSLVLAFSKNVKKGEKFSFHVIKRLENILIWIYHKRQLYPAFATEVLERFEQQIYLGKRNASFDILWLMFCEQYDDKKFCRYLEYRLKTQGNTLGARRIQKKLQSLLLTKSIADSFASLVVGQGIALKNVDEFLDLPMSKLKTDVWSRLLSMSAAPWVCKHPQQEIFDFLETHRDGNHIIPALVCRQILETWYKRGFKVSQLKKGKIGYGLVLKLRRSLPNDETNSAWGLLGKEAQIILKRWKIVNAIEECFSRWDAQDIARKFFWFRYLERIEDILEFQKASALALRLGNYWFVEFGVKGNACYCYSDEQWKNHNFEEQERIGRIKNPSLLKKQARDSKKSHTKGWDYYAKTYQYETEKGPFQYWIDATLNKKRFRGR